MEYYRVSMTDSELHIEGFPDAAKAIHINDPLAKRLADLALHKQDLQFALDCLKALNIQQEYKKLVRQALWRSAIVHYFKCFGKSYSRFSLNEKAIYKSDPIARQVFKHFEELRNKHFVHDENSYTQCIPGAILNQANKSYKIEKIVCFIVYVETLNQQNFGNLNLLIETAKTWVVSEFDNLCDIITKELEAKQYEELCQLYTIEYRLPDSDDIGKTR